MARPDSHIDRLNSNRGPGPNVYSLLAGIKMSRTVPRSISPSSMSGTSANASPVITSPTITDPKAHATRTRPSTAGSHWPGPREKAIRCRRARTRGVRRGGEPRRPCDFVREDEQRPVREHLIDQMINKVDQTSSVIVSRSMLRNASSRGRASAGAAPSRSLPCFRSGSRSPLWRTPTVRRSHAVMSSRSLRGEEFEGDIEDALTMPAPSDGDVP